ncbi:hypothetical protein NM688_g4311 [Phlebia brevispora]|uniref:Uncharacterized protein n=1 Tax=Phlebia brevispora TaxID=194682 RepID=A0ACC1T3V9_9APHY|nr:hypothetical protein NM688_g4311 [Phlebia brevispora]
MAPSHIPTKQKALVLPEKHGKYVVREVDVPKPGPGEVLVRADAVALNPIDWIIQATGIFITQYPAILGWEAAGTVIQLGEGVTSVTTGDKTSPWKYWGRRQACNVQAIQYCACPPCFQNSG